MKLSTVVRLALTVVATSVALAVPAHAQVTVGSSCSVTQDAYGPGLCPPPITDRSNPSPATRLPFTGADAGLAGGLGMLLLLGGVAMRRASAPRRSLP